MRFPFLLKRYGRRKFDERFIDAESHAYTRHKPGHDWKEGDDFPDFSKIKVDQSMNWSAFSLAIWTRFDGKGDYLKDYGVVSYRIDAIKNSVKYCDQFDRNPYKIIHCPENINYSHCQLEYCGEGNQANKTIRQLYRNMLSENCRVEQVISHTTGDAQSWKKYLSMFVHQLKVYIIFLKFKLCILFTTVRQKSD